MARKPAQSHLTFPIVLAITLMVAMLPTRWIQPWTGDLSGLLHVLLRPFTHAGETVGSWLRTTPGGGLDADLPADVRERLKEISGERDRFERLFRAAEREILALREQLSQLQLVPADEDRADVVPLQASIVSRHPREALGLVHLNRGQRQGVETDTIAVFAGVHLVGKIAEASSLSSTLLPLTHPSMGFIDAVVISGASPAKPLSQAPLVQLEPIGDGRFRGTVERAGGVKEGDVVRLIDRRWPTEAQAMVIGTVISVVGQDDNPLRDTLLVRPRYRINEVSQVTLFIRRGGNSMGSTP